MRFQVRATPGGEWSSSGRVDPQLSLIFRPFGEHPMGTISAPSSDRTRGATLYAAPWEQSITIFRPSRRRSAGTVEMQKDL